MKVAVLNISQIAAGENIRKDMTKESLAPLVLSIKEKGILQPLLVRQNGEKYDLVDGFRRYASAKEAKLTEVPVIIAEIGKEDRIEYQLICNLQREDLNPIDEALAYKELGEQFKPEDIVVISGKTLYHIKRILSLLNLCADVKQMIKDGKLSEGHGVVIARLKSEQEQKKLVREIASNKYSPAEAERELRNYTDSLEAAPFDKKDCKECAFNGSLIKDLFDKDNEVKGKCLNLDCYNKKMAEFQKNIAEEFKAKGVRVKIFKEEPRYGSEEYKEIEDAIKFGSPQAEGFDKEQYTNECVKTCKSFACFIGDHGQVAQVCLNPECFRRSLRKAKAIDKKATSIKTGKPELDASIEFEMKKKAGRVDKFKRSFLINGMSKSIKDVQLTRLILHALFQLENGGAVSISKWLGVKEQPNYLVRDMKNIEKLTQAKMDEIIKEVVISRLTQYTTGELDSLGEEANLDISKEFVITKEYLEDFSKAGLMKLSKELKLKVGTLVWKEKKDEIIKILLASGVKGKVPKEMLK